MAASPVAPHRSPRPVMPLPSFMTVMLRRLFQQFTGAWGKRQSQLPPAARWSVTIASAAAAALRFDSINRWSGLAA